MARWTGSRSFQSVGGNVRRPGGGTADQAQGLGEGDRGSPERWAIGIYLASDERYTEAELPTSFGPKTGTPEQGIDHTFILNAGPAPPATRPAPRT